jgi:proline dehydrogenase
VRGVRADRRTLLQRRDGRGLRSPNLRRSRSGCRRVEIAVIVVGSIGLMFRRAILAATTNPAISRFVRRYGMRMGAGRFVAGETFDECVSVLRGLNQQGLVTNTTLLGEGVRDEATARAVTEQYLAILERIAAERLQTRIALKLTHLGLDLGEEIAYANLTRIVRRAAELENFIRIDMEESARVDATLRIYRRLRADGHENVGTVLQSYLYRTARDLEELLPLKPNLRLVKGAYLEPLSVAFPRKSDVDANYIRLAERMLSEGGYSAIATHDQRIIDHVIAYTQRRGIANDRFEFQMLYGIRSQLQLDLVRRGYRVLVATPFGPEWYFYLMRRLAERPANVLFLLRNLILR